MVEDSNILSKLVSSVVGLLGGDSTNFVQKIIRGVQTYEAAKAPFSQVDEESTSTSAKLSMASVLVGGSFNIAAAGFAGEQVRKVYQEVQEGKISGGEAAREGLGEAARAGAAMWAFKAFGGENAGFFGKAAAMLGAVIVGKVADVAAEQTLKLVPLDRIFGGTPVSPAQTVGGGSPDHGLGTQYTASNTGSAAVAKS